MKGRKPRGDQKGQGSALLLPDSTPKATKQALCCQDWVVTSTQVMEGCEGGRGLCLR